MDEGSGHSGTESQLAGARVSQEAEGQGLPGGVAGDAGVGGDAVPGSQRTARHGEGGVVLLRGVRGVFLVRLAGAAALPRPTRGAVPSVHEHSRSIVRAQ